MSNLYSKDQEKLRLVIPSDGAMYQETLDFLKDCGMRVRRPSDRGYVGQIVSIPSVEIVFQRTADISSRVEAGDADVGLVGYDRFAENRIDDSEATVVIPNLGFGKCSLVVAVPESWVDVESMSDLADLAVIFQETNRELRVATKYPSLTRKFLYGHDVNYFSLSLLSGTVEPAPSMGYADFIVDLTASGQTLRENHLKQIIDGTVVQSEGSLIANRRLLAESDAKKEIFKEIIERIEAQQLSDVYCRITANITGESEAEIALKVTSLPKAAGLHGPTISPVYAPDSRSIYSATVVIPKEDMAEVIDHLRKIGGASVNVYSPSGYMFNQDSNALERLHSEIGFLR